MTVALFFQSQETLQKSHRGIFDARGSRRRWGLLSRPVAKVISVVQRAVSGGFSDLDLLLAEWRLTE